MRDDQFYNTLINLKLLFNTVLTTLKHLIMELWVPKTLNN